MDTGKFIDFFNPQKVEGEITVIGCGAGGSTIVEGLARMGISEVNIFDFDTVCSHNIANQLFFENQIGMSKVDALEEIILQINPQMKINKYNKAATAEDLQQFGGYLFLCVDSIKTRKELANSILFNPNYKWLFDCRMRLTDGQLHTADWSDISDQQNYLKTMNFTDEDVKADTQLSACNLEMNIAPTVRLLSSYCVSNFINTVIAPDDVKKLVLIDSLKFIVDAF